MQKKITEDTIQLLSSISIKAMYGEYPFNNVQLCDNFMHDDYIQFKINNDFNNKIREKILSMLIDRSNYLFKTSCLMEKRKFLDAYPEHKFISEYIYNYRKSKNKIKKYIVNPPSVKKDDILKNINQIFLNNEFSFFNKNPISFKYDKNKSIIAVLLFHKLGGFISCKINMNEYKFVFDISQIYSDGQSKFWQSDENYNSIKNLLDIGIPTQIEIVKEVHKVFYS